VTSAWKYHENHFSHQEIFTFCKVRKTFINLAKYWWFCMKNPGKCWFYVKTHFFSENHIILWKCQVFMKKTEIGEICDFHDSTIEKALKYQRIIKHPRRWSQKSAKSWKFLVFCRKSAFSRKSWFFAENQKFHDFRTFRIHLQKTYIIVAYSNGFWR